MEQKSKTKQPDAQIIKSLENLKEELLGRDSCLVCRELLFKINSCLFSEYPVNFSKGRK